MKMFNNLLFILSLCIVAQKTHSLSIRDRGTSDESAMEPYSTDDDDTPLPSDQIMDNPQIHPLLNHRRSDSAEKYFHWASKTNRPMEYLRGKRFWLFAKKDDNGISREAVPVSNALQTAMKQGIWRSGIVGRRRR